MRYTKLKAVTATSIGILSLGMSQSSYAQTCGDGTCRGSIEFEIIDNSIKDCLDSWSQNGASELSRKACLFALPTPTIKHQIAQEKHGNQNLLTQYTAFSTLKANNYVVESYIELMTVDSSTSWAKTMCGYNTDAIKFSNLPYNLLETDKIEFANSIKPRLKEIAQVCKTLP